MKQVRVMVVDDHALFRRGLVSLLQEMPGFQVVDQAGHGQEALELVENARPDVILVDVNMPVMDGVETVRQLKRRDFQGKIIMLTISRNEPDLLGAITAGADGYLLKNVEPADLETAIVDVLEGRGALSPEVTRAVMQALSSKGTGGYEEKLSGRELQVLSCIADGATTTQVAEQLSISESTVKTHVRHILEKLDATNRAEAVQKALNLGLIRNPGMG
jgi:DNA-binding NarL/FixJ family response regulator